MRDIGIARNPDRSRERGRELFSFKANETSALPCGNFRRLFFTDLNLPTTASDIADRIGREWRNTHTGGEENCISPLGLAAAGGDPDRDRPLAEAAEGGGERVVEDLEHADEAEPHAEAEEAARVGHEGDHRDLLVAHDLRHHRVLQVQGLFFIFIFYV